MRRKLIVYIGICLLALPAFGQRVYISKFASGDYLANELHRIELFNESARTADISGYLVVTRQYVARMPKGTRIPAWGTLRLGKSDKGGGVDVAYNKLKDFNIRIPRRKENGDFAVLMNSAIQIVDAFFYSDRSRVGFLPSSEDFMTQEHDLIRVDIPGESSAVWSSIEIPPDPAMVFVRINKKWEINSRNANLYPAAEYSNLRVSYVDGVISIKWQTLFENDCYYHVIERRSDDGSFRMLDRRPAVGNSSSLRSYIYYDNRIVEDRAYEYRVRNTDKFGNTVYSEEVSINTGNDLGGVSLDHFREGNVQNIRFSSKETQRIRIQLLDEEFRQIAVLFQDQVQAEKQMLLQYKTPLPIGKYYLIAETPIKRIYKDFIIAN